MNYYSDIRSRIKSGDLLAWQHRSWKSWYDIKIQFVRIVSQSEYSHVGIAWVIGERTFILEAVTPKIRIFPLSKELPFYWIPMNIEWSESTEAFALNCVGDEYSQFQAMTAYFDKLKIGGDHLWECAEYVLKVYDQAGLNLGTRAVPSNVVKAAQNLGIPTYYILPDISPPGPASPA